MGGKKKKEFTYEEILNNPFAEVAPDLGFKTKSDISGKDSTDKKMKSTKKKGTFNFSDIERVVLQKSRKGRGGKTVTFVSVLPDMSGEKLKSLCSILKKQMGCGAWVEDGTVVLQGDVSERALEFMEKKGVKNLIRGN